MSNQRCSSQLDQDELKVMVEELIQQPILRKRWQLFCAELGVTDASVTQWEYLYNCRNLQPYELFMKILTSWRDENGPAATKDSLWETLNNVDKVLERGYLQKMKTQSSRGSRCLVFLGFFFVVVAMIYRNNENQDQETSAVFIDKRPETTSGVWYNVGTLNKHFVGRQSELNKLEEIYSNGGDKIVLISGLGGIGKSELAKKFAHDLYAKGAVSVTWLNGESEASFQQSLMGLAHSLGIPTEDPSSKAYGSHQLFNNVAESMSRNLTVKSWLLIFDNVDEMNSGLLFSLQLIIEKENTFAILTSRNRDVFDEEMFHIRLEEWTSEDAAEFTKLSLKLDNSSEQLITELCKTLGNHALGMQQTVAYILKQQTSSLKGQSYSISDYLVEFEAGWKKTSKILDYKLSEIKHKHAKTTLVTFDITIDKIKETQGETGKSASAILKIIAYLDPNGIPFDFIQKTVSLSENWDGSDSEEAIALLKTYSLVKIENYVISVHRLLQQVIRIKWSSTNEEFRLLQALLQTYQKKDYTPFSISELPHIVSVWNYSLKDDNLMSIFQVMPFKIFTRLVEVGFYLEIEHFSRVNHRRLAQVFTEDHLHTLQMKKNLDLALELKGEYQKSLEIRKEVWEKEKEILGEEHELALTTAHCIANVLIKLEKLDEPKTMLEKVLESQKKYLGEFHPLTISTKRSLATLLYKKGETDVSLRMWNEVLEWERRELGERHPDTLDTRHSIGESLLLQGKYSEAKELFQDLVPLSKEVLGEEHPDTIDSMLSFGLTHFFLGEKEASLEILQQVLTLQKKRLGPDHPDIFLTQEVLNSIF